MTSHLPRAGLLLLASLLIPAPACAQQDTAEATRELGDRYVDQIDDARTRLQSDPNDQGARRSLVRALLQVGRYDEAAEEAIELPNLRGEALLALGKLDEAEASFRQAIGEAGQDRLTAEFNLARLIYDRGHRSEATSRFDRFIDVYNRGGGLSSQELTAVADAVRYLGRTSPELFQDAAMAYGEAITADPNNIDPHLRLADLFIEKYNSTEAYSALQDAVEIDNEHPLLLLGLAQAAAFDGNRAQAARLARQSLEVNPNLVAARSFLARMLLDVEDYEGAEAELQRALQVNPASLEALSTLAALHFLRDDRERYERLRAQVRQLNPSYAGLHIIVSEIAAQHRLYADAARLAEEGTRIDSLSWAAHGALGLNRFRLGRIDEARQSLERAFAGDPYNVWIKNNLDLLDTFTEYESPALDGFELMVHRNEADILLPYLEIAAVQAHSALSQRYGDEPRGPIRLELYPRSADFSVRTVGLAGLGALGVSFGDVLALDSPSAREPGSYNWVTTLWHEMAHTVALGVSGSRVPRWFTEGLSVLEEARADPGWERSITPEFLLIYEAGELPPVSRLNEGFVRPRSGQHLAHAYEMAALVGEWIEETHGFDAIIRMLQGYRDGASTEQVFRQVLGSETEVIDDAFDAWLREKRHPETARDYGLLMEAARAQHEAGNLDQAVASLEDAAALFPMTASGSPYAILARLQIEAGEEEAAVQSLEALTRYDDSAYSANLQLAELLEQAGDLEAAAAALNRAVWIYPFEMEPHRKLAELYARTGNHVGAVRERRAILGLKPTDRPAAHYELARALRDAGDTDAARRELLRALEIAPGFEQAQALLLELHEG